MKKFTATAHSTADEKAKFFAHFQAFVLRGFKKTMFHKWFYTRLSNCFGHIAHTNLEGFYQEWFIDTQAREAFVAHCIAYPCHGDPSYTYSDVEEALVQWLNAEKILNVLQGTLAIEQEEAEIRLRDTLIARHGMPNYDVPLVKPAEKACALTLV